MNGTPVIIDEVNPALNPMDKNENEPVHTASESDLEIKTARPEPHPAKKAIPPRRATRFHGKIVSPKAKE